MLFILSFYPSNHLPNESSLNLAKYTWSSELSMTQWTIWWWSKGIIKLFFSARNCKKRVKISNCFSYEFKAEYSGRIYCFFKCLIFLEPAINLVFLRQLQLSDLKKRKRAIAGAKAHQADRKRRIFWLMHLRVLETEQSPPWQSGWPTNSLYGLLRKSFRFFTVSTFQLLSVAWERWFC